MAGNHDGNRVAAIGETHGAGSLRISQLSRQRSISSGVAIRDTRESKPYAPLEFRAARFERQIEIAPLAGEILFELQPRTFDDVIGPTRELRGAARRVAAVFEPDANQSRVGSDESQP